MEGWGHNKERLGQNSTETQQGRNQVSKGLQWLYSFSSASCNTCTLSLGPVLHAYSFAQETSHDPGISIIQVFLLYLYSTFTASCSKFLVLLGRASDTACYMLSEASVASGTLAQTSMIPLSLYHAYL